MSHPALDKAMADLHAQSRRVDECMEAAQFADEAMAQAWAARKAARDKLDEELLEHRRLEHLLVAVRLSRNARAALKRAERRGPDKKSGRHYYALTLDTVRECGAAHYELVWAGLLLTGYLSHQYRLSTLGETVRGMLVDGVVDGSESEGGAE